ncbi:hypothetical protein EKD04_013090 [Chloroflexales bacterium ZM16-3]|nr:hypothetical protein [Chloroflexales bacterium ZM16-3]
MTAQRYLLNWLPLTWRQLGLCCAAAVVLLLLLQPLLCVAHCAVDDYFAPRAAAQAAPNGPFLCHIAAPEGVDTLIIPAFWPGVLPALVLIIMACALWFRLGIARISPLSPRRWAPPIPPPRLSCAA